MAGSIEELLGLSDPSQANTRALAHQLRGEQQMGDIYSLSPTLSNFGQNMSQRALSTAEAVGDRRQQGLTRARQAEQDAFEREKYDTGLEYRDSQNALALEQREEDYERGLSAEERAHKRALELQESKDAEAARRAQIKADAEVKGNNLMGTSERKNYRLATNAAQALPDIIAKVEASPSAFGATKDIVSYGPDWTPNVVAESAKNIQKKMLSDEEQLARNAVYEQAYQIINDLAGAALSEHEKTRIEAFTPAPNDDARTVANKLRGALETANRLHGSFDMYSDYQPLKSTEDETVAPPPEEAEFDPVAAQDEMAAIEAELAEIEAAENEQGGSTLPKAVRGTRRGRGAY